MLGIFVCIGDMDIPSLVIVTPKYLADSVVVTVVPLIVAGTWDLTQLLEITRRELCVGEIPEDVIQSECD